MRRVLPLAVLAALLAGCGDGKLAKPLPKTVVGPIAKPTEVKGDPAVGRKLFSSLGCAGCHTYKPAASTGKVGPDLDKLAADAQKAGKPLDEYVRESIVNPGAYIVPGFQNGVMPPYASLKPEELAGLVAFLTEKQ